MWQGYTGLVRLGFTHIQPSLWNYIYGNTYMSMYIHTHTHTQTHTHMCSPPCSLGIWGTLIPEPPLMLKSLMWNGITFAYQKLVRYSSGRSRKRKDDLYRSRLLLFRQGGTTVGLRTRLNTERDQGGSIFIGRFVEVIREMLIRRDVWGIL